MVARTANRTARIPQRLRKRFSPKRPSPSAGPKQDRINRRALQHRHPCRSHRLSGPSKRSADLASPRWPPVAWQGVNKSSGCLEHWLLSTRKEPMIITVELNELSAGDVAGHIAAGRNTYGPVVPTVQHQRGHGNPWQQLSHVGVAQRLEHGPNAAGTGGRAQQPGPPGPRLGITRKARPEGFDPGRATPFADELLAPGVILACPQRVRIVRRPTALGQ